MPGKTDGVTFWWVFSHAFWLSWNKRQTNNVLLYIQIIGGLSPFTCWSRGITVMTGFCLSCGALALVPDVGQMFWRRSLYFLYVRWSDAICRFGEYPAFFLLLEAGDAACSDNWGAVMRLRLDDEVLFILDHVIDRVPRPHAVNRQIG